MFLPDDVQGSRDRRNCPPIIFHVILAERDKLMFNGILRKRQTTQKRQQYRRNRIIFFELILQRISVHLSQPILDQAVGIIQSAGLESSVQIGRYRSQIVYRMIGLRILVGDEVHKVPGAHRFPIPDFFVLSSKTAEITLGLRCHPFLIQETNLRIRRLRDQYLTRMMHLALHLLDTDMPRRSITETQFNQEMPRGGFPVVPEICDTDSGIHRIVLVIPSAGSLIGIQIQAGNGRRKTGFLIIPPAQIVQVRQKVRCQTALLRISGTENKHITSFPTRTSKYGKAQY